MRWVLWLFSSVAVGGPSCEVAEPADWAICQDAYRVEVNKYCGLNPASLNFSSELKNLIGGDRFASGWFTFSNLLTPARNVLRYALDDEGFEGLSSDEVGSYITSGPYINKFLGTEVFSVILIILVIGWAIAAIIMCCCFGACKCCRRCCGQLCRQKCCNDRRRQKPFYGLRRSKLVGLVIGWSVVLVLLLYIFITLAIYGAKFAKSIDDETASCAVVGNAYRAAYGYDGWPGLSGIHTTMGQQVLRFDSAMPESYFSNLLNISEKINSLEAVVASKFYFSLAQTLKATQVADFRAIHLPTFASTNFPFLGQSMEITERCNPRTPFEWPDAFNETVVDFIQNQISECFGIVPHPPFPPPIFPCSEFFNSTILQVKGFSTFQCLNERGITRIIGTESNYYEGAKIVHNFYNSQISNLILKFNLVLDEISNVLSTLRDSTAVNVLDHVPWVAVGFFSIVCILFLFAAIFGSILLFFCVRRKEPSNLGHIKKSFLALWCIFCLTGIPASLISSLGLMGVSLSSESCLYLHDDIQLDADFSPYWPSKLIKNIFDGTQNESQIQSALEICLTVDQPDTPRKGNIMVAAGLDDDVVSRILPGFAKTLLFLNETYAGFLSAIQPMRDNFQQNSKLFAGTSNVLITDWWSLANEAKKDTIQLVVPGALLFSSILPNSSAVPNQIVERLDEMSLHVGPSLDEFVVTDWPSLQQVSRDVYSTAANWSTGFFVPFAAALDLTNSNFVGTSQSNLCVSICIAGFVCPSANVDLVVTWDSNLVELPKDEENFWTYKYWNEDPDDFSGFSSILECLVGGTPTVLPISLHAGLVRAMFFINSYNNLVYRAKSASCADCWVKPTSNDTTELTYKNFEDFANRSIDLSSSAADDVERFFVGLELLGEDQSKAIESAIADVQQMFRIANCLKITTAILDSSDVICDHYGPFAAILFWDGILYGIAAFIAFVLGVKGWHYWRDRLRLAKSSFVSEDSTDELSIEKLLVAAILDEDLEEVTRLSGLVDVATVHVGGNATLHYAARIGNLGILEHLLEQGCNVNEENEARYTPLLIATSEFHISCVTELLEWGANPAKADEFGDTPLHIAARIGNLELVKIILTSGVDPEIQTSKSRLYADEVALQMGAVEVENYLIDAKSPQSRRARESDIGALRAVVERHQATHSREKVSAVVTSKSSK